MAGVFFFLSDYSCKFPVSVPSASLNRTIFLKKNPRKTRFIHLCLKHSRDKKHAYLVNTSANPAPQKIPHLVTMFPGSPPTFRLQRASWGESLLFTHDACANREVILVLCSLSIFKLIVWKKAAVNFGHRLFD